MQFALLEGREVSLGCLDHDAVHIVCVCAGQLRCGPACDRGTRCGRPCSGSHRSCIAGLHDNAGTATPARKSHLPTCSSTLQSDAHLMGFSAAPPTQADEALLHAWHFGGDYTYDSDLSKAEEVGLGRADCNGPATCPCSCRWRTDRACRRDRQCCGPQRVNGILLFNLCLQSQVIVFELQGLTNLASGTDWDWHRSWTTVQ